MKRRPAPKFSDHLHFVTARTNHGVTLFRHPSLCREFLAALQGLHESQPFGLYAYALMPEHVHLIVQSEDGRISDLMGRIKSVSARRILARLREGGKRSLLEKLEKPKTGKRRHSYQIWQQGFHTIELWSEWMIQQKLDYLHANPLQEGLVQSARDYPWSSFRVFHGLQRHGHDVPVDPIDM